MQQEGGARRQAGSVEPRGALSRRVDLDEGEVGGCKDVGGLGFAGDDHLGGSTVAVRDLRRPGFGGGDLGALLRARSGGVHDRLVHRGDRPVVDEHELGDPGANEVAEREP